MKIDFVVTWVDGNDPKWQNERAKYNPGVNKSFNTNIRYRDTGLFQYWFRAVEKYAPWVNKIYVVTSGQRPQWLNVKSDKLVFVKHEDYIPSEYLPTFNSNVIELNLHRIQGLSEHFVLFNDDMFLTAPVTEEDFFHNGLPKQLGIYTPVVPIKEFSNIVFNDVRIINKNFNKYADLKKHWKKFISLRYGWTQLRTWSTLPWKSVLGYVNLHLPAPHMKSIYQEVWEREYDVLNITSKSKFRSRNDVNHWLLIYWQIEKGLFEPQSIKLGYFYTLKEFDQIVRAIKSEDRKMICINDDYNVSDYFGKMDIIRSLFKRKLSKKSVFEL